MSEYATYKLWNGRKAPNNLEFNGRLIGEKVTSTMPTTQMSYEYGNGDDRTEEYMELIDRTPEDTVACHCHAFVIWYSDLNAVLYPTIARFVAQGW